MTKLDQEEAKERAKKRNQGGGIILLETSIFNYYKFRVIMDDKHDNKEMSQLFIFAI